MSLHTTPDSYTKLLIHSDTSDGSTTFVDSSANAHTVVTNGNPTHSTTQKKFGKTSIHCDDSADGFGAASHADFNLGTLDWTLDFWWYPTSIEAENYFLHTTGGWSMLCLYYPSNNGFKIIHNNPSSWQTTVQGGEGTLSANRWYHIAFVRANNYHTIYLNGKIVAGPSQDTRALTNTNTTLSASSYMAGNITGYVDEYRLSVDIARWTGEFVPPSAPYSQISVESSSAQEARMTRFQNVATGGEMTTSGPYRIHKFKSSGTLSVGRGGISNAEVLIVAGGGGGGSSVAGSGGGGGGGAGGLVYYSSCDITAGNKTITVGAGGAKGTPGSSQDGTDGADSAFTNLTTAGGGGGGGRQQGSGHDGGSGGGGGYKGYTTVANGGAANGQGTGNAGSGVQGGSASGGGGGGAGGAGQLNTGSGGGTGGVGGAGLEYAISGESVWYASGGYGGVNGQGSSPNDGTGNGGNGQYAQGSGDISDGSDGIIIVRYKPFESDGGSAF